MKRKYNIFYRFDENYSNGYYFTVVDGDYTWPFEHEEYIFSDEIILEQPSKEDITKAAIIKLDNDISNLYQQINAIKEKKQQLLALEHKE